MSWRMRMLLVGVFSVSMWVAPTLAQESGLPEALNVAALARDAERLFVGTFDRGLIVQTEGGSRLVDPQIDLNINALAVDPARRLLWVGTARGLTRCALATLSCQRIADGSIHALLVASDGTLLAGGDVGLLSVSSRGAIQTLDRKRGAPFRAVWSLAEAHDGTLFVGTTNGLHFAARASWFGARGRRDRVGMITGDLSDDWITALRMEQGRLQVGTYHAGIASFRFAQGKLTRERSDSSLGYVNPQGLLALQHGSWAVATMEGLRVGSEGNWRTIVTPDRDVTVVLERAPGSYWVGTRHGLISLELDDLRLARVSAPVRPSREPAASTRVE